MCLCGGSSNKIDEVAYSHITLHCLRSGLCAVFIYVMLLTENNGIYWPKYFFSLSPRTDMASCECANCEYILIGAAVHTRRSRLTLNQFENVLTSMLVPHRAQSIHLIFAICFVFGWKLKQVAVARQNKFHRSSTWTRKSDDFNIYQFAYN